jgi:broad specificity phosphatase PhoE
MAPAHPHRIVFLRHGQTAYNAQNRLQGQRDVPLDGKGREQAQAIGRFLGASMGPEMARLDAAGGFWASPLARTRQTMTLARLAIGLPAEPYRLDGRLMELNFGAWEGRTWDEVKRSDPAGIAARRADKWGFAPPGGESYADMAARLTPWLAERDGDALVVAHGGVARALMALLAGVEPAAAADAEIWQGRALIFEAGGCSWIG